MTGFDVFIIRIYTTFLDLIHTISCKKFAASTNIIELMSEVALIVSC